MPLPIDHLPLSDERVPVAGEALYSALQRHLLLAITDGLFLVVSHASSFGEPFVFAVIVGLIERNRLHPGYRKRSGEFIRYLH